MKEKQVGESFLKKNTNLNATAEILVTQKTQKGKVIFSETRTYKLTLGSVELWSFYLGGTKLA